MSRRGWVAALMVVTTLSACDSRAGQSEIALPTHEAPGVAPSIPATVVDPDVTAKMRTFEGRDTDHDGFISNAENAAAAANVFNAMDRDQDGSITVSEMDSARIALGLAMVPSSEQIIADADQDADGKLTLAEWIAHEGRVFKDADKDGDGKLNRTEWLMLPKLEDPQPASGSVALGTDPDD